MALTWTSAAKSNTIIALPSNPALCRWPSTVARGKSVAQKRPFDLARSIFAVAAGSSEDKRP